MVNIEDVYGQSEYLKAQDLPPKPVKYVIEDVYVRTFYQQGVSTTKVVLKLRGEKRSFIVNRTNAGILSGMFGRETDGWKGKEITVAKQLIRASDGAEVFSVVVQRAAQ
ncbi:MAG: hypothetical protein JRN37_07980 [Nitrososphaerota archaeon]|jgi:hypothetical protein|nr:hypothetical protein [Nitrososphaerota archaeon]MDG7036250.1 hypothetical protein [Nitrososphaerota archaeon]MDG7039070.1 hypothetical protein [Nitrososphaerota archaeon]